MRNREAARYARLGGHHRGADRIGGRRRVRGARLPPRSGEPQSRRCLSPSRCSNNPRSSHFRKSSSSERFLPFARPTPRNTRIKIAPCLRTCGSPSTDATAAATTTYTPTNAPMRERRDVRCEGEVHIDLANANSASGKAAGQLGPLSTGTLQVKTSNLSFNRSTGEASTPAPVRISVSVADRGAAWESPTANAIRSCALTTTLNSSCSFAAHRRHARERDREQPRNTARRPYCSAQGARDGERGTRELVRGHVSVRARRGLSRPPRVAEGHPQIRSTEGGGKISVLAARFEAVLNPAGWVEHVVADGSGERSRTAAGTDHFSAAHAEFTMVPESNLTQDMNATGSVTAESKQAAIRVF